MNIKASLNLLLLPTRLRRAGEQGVKCLGIYGQSILHNLNPIIPICL